MKTIAIIGAGWTGIGILRTLKERGFNVTLFEKNNDIGGTWHPDNYYAHLKVHAMAFTITFPDFPLPAHIDPYERLSSREVFDYLKKYCQHYQLMENIQLNSNCSKISYNSIQQKHALQIIQDGKNIEVGNFDYVIYTHGYTERTIPDFKGADSFTGEIYHSFDISEQKLKKLVEDNKKIVVIGGGKTATDFILAFHELNYQVQWLCRAPYWFFNFDKQKSLIITSNKSISAFFKRWLILFAFLFSKNMPKITYWLWKSTDFIHSYDESAFDLNRCHLGILDLQQINSLKNYYHKNAIKSEIESIKNDLIILKNGEQLKADVLICCTGSGPKKFPEILIDGVNFELEHANKIYRSAILPQLPKLVFTVYLPFGLGIIRGLFVANWIESYIKLDPDTEYLFNHAKNLSSNHLMNHPIFNSNQALLIEHGEYIKEFVKGGEISPIDYAKFFFAHIFSGTPLIPPHFKIPKNIRGSKYFNTRKEKGVK